MLSSSLSVQMFQEEKLGVSMTDEQFDDKSNSASSNENTALSHIHVLVVDDDADSRDFISFVLEMDGAVVTTATSATDALDVIKQSRLDVIISDIGLPEMDGYTLMRQIRSWSSEQTQKIPAIALTAYAGEYNQNLALEAGFQMHIAKPVEPDELVAAVQKVIAEN